MGKTAASFEDQMAAVRSILGKEALPSDVKSLETEFKRLGATTRFTATEAAQAGELLARAGFTPQKSIESLGAILNVAAAENIALAKATDIVVGQMRAFSEESLSATQISDTLAFVSRSLKTNMTELNAGLSNAASAASMAGARFSDVTVVLGLMQDANIKGSKAGTMLKNMFNKLVKPSDKARDLMKKYGIQIDRTKDGFVDFTKLGATIEKTVAKIGDKTKSAGVLAEVFGLRGGVASESLRKALTRLGKEGFTDFLTKAREAKGVAEEMADLRMQSLTGQLIILKSALEGLAIEAFSGSLGPMTTLVKRLALSIQIVVLAMQDFGKTTKSPSLQKFKKDFGEGAEGIQAFGEGLKLAVLRVERFGKRAAKAFDVFTKTFGLKGEANRGLGRMLGLFFPVLIVVGAITAAVAFLALPFVLLGAAVATAGVIVLKIFAGIAVAVAAFAAIAEVTRNKGESLFERMIGLGKQLFFFMKDFAKGFFGPRFQASMADLKDAFGQLFDVMRPVLELLGFQFNKVSGDGEAFGSALAGVFRLIAFSASMMIRMFALVAGFIQRQFVTPFLSGVIQMISAWMIFAGLLTPESFGAVVAATFKAVGLMVLNLLGKPLLVVLDLLGMIFQQFSRLAALGGADTLAAVFGGSADAFKALASGATGAAGTALGPPKTFFDQKKDEHAKRSADLMADLEGAKSSGNPLPEFLKGLEETLSGDKKSKKGKIQIDNNVCLDGKKVATASGRAKADISERMGGVKTPFNKAQVLNNASATT
jgi:TP901 family phage tail tape measure protein